ncbi:MAG: LamG domain-containing protein [bacterium]
MDKRKKNKFNILFIFLLLFSILGPLNVLFNTTTVEAQATTPQWGTVGYDFGRQAYKNVTTPLTSSDPVPQWRISGTNWSEPYIGADGTVYSTQSIGGQMSVKGVNGSTGAITYSNNLPATWLDTRWPYTNWSLTRGKVVGIAPGGDVVTVQYNNDIHPTVESSQRFVSNLSTSTFLQRYSLITSNWKDLNVTSLDPSGEYIFMGQYLDRQAFHSSMSSTASAYWPAADHTNCDGFCWNEATTFPVYIKNTSGNNWAPSQMGDSAGSLRTVVSNNRQVFTNAPFFGQLTAQTGAYPNMITSGSNSTADQFQTVVSTWVPWLQGTGVAFGTGLTPGNGKIFAVGAVGNASYALAANSSNYLRSVLSDTAFGNGTKVIGSYCNTACSNNKLYLLKSSGTTKYIQTYSLDVRPGVLSATTASLGGQNFADFASVPGYFYTLSYTGNQIYFEGWNSSTFTRIFQKIITGGNLSDPYGVILLGRNGGPDIMGLRMAIFNDGSIVINTSAELIKFSPNSYPKAKFTTPTSLTYNVNQSVSFTVNATDTDGNLGNASNNVSQIFMASDIAGNFKNFSGAAATGYTAKKTIVKTDCTGANSLSNCTYTYNWTPTQAGTYLFVVNAYDSAGASCSGNYFYAYATAGIYQRCDGDPLYTGPNGAKDYLVITVKPPPWFALKGSQSFSSSRFVNTLTNNENDNPASKPPIIYYSFNEGAGTNLYDDSGNGRSGTLSTNTMWATSKDSTFGKAGLFDNLNTVVTANSANMVQNLITLEAWIKPAVTTIQPILEYGNGTSYGVHLWQYNTSGLGTYLWINFTDLSGTQRWMQSAYPVFTANNWYHVATTYDGNTAVLYVNGQPINYVTGQPANSNVMGGLMLQTSYNFNVGYRPAGGKKFSGLIDEVKVYDYARTQAQIQMDMTPGITNSYLSDTVVLSGTTGILNTITNLFGSTDGRKGISLYGNMVELYKDRNATSSYSVISQNTLDKINPQYRVDLPMTVGGAIAGITGGYQISLAALKDYVGTDTTKKGVVYEINGAGGKIEIDYNVDDAANIKTGVILYITGASETRVKLTKDSLNSSVAIMSDSDLYVDNRAGVNIFNAGLITSKNVYYKCATYNSTTETSGCKTEQNGFTFAKGKVNIDYKNTTDLGAGKDVSVAPTVQISYDGRYIPEYRKVFSLVEFTSDMVGFEL